MKLITFILSLALACSAYGQIKQSKILVTTNPADNVSTVSNGWLQLNSGGIKFSDGSVQTNASSGSGTGATVTAIGSLIVGGVTNNAGSAATNPATAFAPTSATTGMLTNDWIGSSVTLGKLGDSSFYLNIGGGILTNSGYCQLANNAGDLANYYGGFEGLWFIGSGTGLTGITAGQVGALSNNHATSVNLASNLTVGGNAYVSGSVTGATFTGNGSNLTGLTASQVSGALTNNQAGVTLTNATFKGITDHGGGAVTNVGTVTFSDGSQLRTNGSFVGMTTSNATLTGTVTISPTAVSTLSNLNFALTARLERSFPTNVTVTTSGLSANLSALVFVYSASNVAVTLPAIGAANTIWVNGAVTNQYTVGGQATNIWNIVTDSRTNVFWNILK